MRLAQISDLHIVRPGQELLGRIDTARFLERCVARLRAMPEAPDAVMVTGDLVDQGTVEEYEALRALLAPLTVPAYLALGNHDDRAAFRAVFGDATYLRPPSELDFVQYTFDLDGVRVIVLDTNDPQRPGGKLCATRRAWLAQELEAAKAGPVIVAMHHPPFATGIGFMDQYGLDGDDAAAMAAILRDHPNVERVICGHLHPVITARFGGTIASTAPSPAHHVALAFAKETPGAFTFEPPAFALHVWVAPSLVTHHVHVDAFDGPHRF